MSAFAGKVAVVTGGGSGIGEAVARRFAALGCAVVVAGRRLQELRRVADSIGAEPVVTDVADEVDVIRLFQACASRHGRLDILVTSAGIGGPTAPVEQMDLAAFKQVFDVNVRGLMFCVKHAVPLFAGEGGAIVNIASRVAFRPFPLRSAYGSSKFAVRGMTEAFAQELGPLGIRVNALCPGAVDTELFRHNAAGRARALGMDPEAYIEETMIKSAALGRLVTLDDVVNAVVYLAGPESAAMTGESLRLDCGRS